MFVERLFDEGVHLLGHLFAVLAAALHSAAEEGVALFLEHHETGDFAHAVDLHHSLDDVGGTFEVVAGARGDLPEEDLFGGPSAQQNVDLGQQFMFLGEVFVLFWRIQGIAQRRKTAGDDRDLGDLLGPLGRLGDQGVTALVVGDDLLLFLVDAAALLRQAGDGPFNRFAQVRLGHGLLAFTPRQQCRFVDDVGQIGPGETRRQPRNLRDVDVRVDLDPLHMYVEDVDAPLEIRFVHQNLAVETTRAKKRGIEDFGTVGRGEDDDGGVGTETVHLGKKLVQRLLPLVIAPHHARCGTAFADGVDLVDEDDRRRIFFRLLEEVADTCGADTDEHLDEARTGDGEEGNVRLSRNGFGQQRFTGTRAAHEQHPFGDLGAEFDVTLRVTEEVDDLEDLLLRLLGAGDVVELRLRFLRVDQFFRLSHAQNAAAHVALHPSGEEHPDGDDDQEGKQPAEHLRKPVGFGEAAVVDALFVQQRHQGAVLADQAGGVNHLAALFHARSPDVGLADGHLVDLFRLDQVFQFGVAHFDVTRRLGTELPLHSAALADQRLEKHDDHDGEDREGDQGVLVEKIVVFRVVIVVLRRTHSLSSLHLLRQCQRYPLITGDPLFTRHVRECVEDFRFIFVQDARQDQGAPGFQGGLELRSQHHQDIGDDIGYDYVVY